MMCGIAGQYCFGPVKPDGDLLTRMAERLAHRGPDGEGTYIGGPVALAHRRLAIIDLSDDGRQPMTNEDRTLWLVFNGEIYNFLELRHELAEKGHTFASKSDTEVILHAYEEWGVDCVQRFNGMWAFALWDERRHHLFCARDRFGIKPFYYTRTDDALLFASEIKALLEHPGVGRTPDEAMLGTFLAWGVLDHSGMTMFTGIHQLKPAHAMVVTPEGAQPPFRYWDVKINPDIRSALPDEEIPSTLFSLLQDAVRIHLRSDVAVGTCLSGGIDSSAVTALITRQIRKEALVSVGERQKTFSVIFDDPRFDESRYIDEIVTAAGVDARRIQPGPDQLREDLERLVYVQEEPFGSLSIYAQYCVMRLASQQVKVVLDGQGADELLAGYLAYQGPYICGLIRTFHWQTAIQECIGFMRYHRGFFGPAIRQVFVRRNRRQTLRCTSPPFYRYRGRLDEVLYRELTASNLPALLHYEDRNSMAFSLEARVPYLDVRLVEYIASLPLSQKIRGGVTKISLRSALKGIIPEPIRCRMDKMGFVTPEEVWMKESLRTFVLGILGSSSFRARPCWDADAVLQRYLAFLEGRSAYSPDLWRIVCTELWLRRFFDCRKAGWSAARTLPLQGNRSL